MNKAGSIRTDDRLMAERLRRGDNLAWNEFFRRYRDRIYGLCFRMLRNLVDAEDAAQDVFIRSVRAIGTFRGDSSLNTWLYRIAVNICLTRLETAKRNGNSVELDPELESNDPAPDRLAASSQLQIALRRAFDQLDPLFRLPVHLRDVEECSYEEIVQILSIPLETVKTRIHRGRKLLQQLLAEYSA